MTIELGDDDFKDGEYYVIVEATDTAGNTNFAYQQIKKDTNASVINITASKEAEDWINGNNKDNAKFDVTIDDTTSKVETVSVYTYTPVKKEKPNYSNHVGWKKNTKYSKSNLKDSKMTIKLGSKDFSAAIMLTQAQYDYLVRQGQLKSYAILFLAAALSFICCAFTSKRYVAPILKKIEQIKANGESGDSLGIREIDDLFDFLVEKDSHYEDRLLKLDKAKQKAEREAELAKAAYDHALEEHQLAQSEIQQLSDEKKKEIVLEDYEFFICNLKTLTPTEYRIYELYLGGKSAKEIMEITVIKENTLKYHNKNIYNKLGVSSRKQLLRFASLKQHQDSKGDPVK